MLITIKQNQTGAITIIMAAVLLFLLSMISVFAARVTVTDHRVASNLYRTAQSKTAGHAALEEAMAVMTGRMVANAAGGTVDLFTNAVNAECPDIAAGDTGRFCVTDNNGQGVGIARAQFTALAGNIVDLAVSSWSPGGEAQRTLAQRVRFTQALQPEALNWPLIVRGSVSANNVVLQNETNGAVQDRALWAGGAIAGGNEPNSNMLSPGATTGQYGGEANLNGLANANAVFQNFFRFDTNTVRNVATDINCAGGCNNASAAIDPMEGAGGIFWLTGDLNLDANVVLGAANDPVLLIVNGGNFSMTNVNAVVHGLVFVIGDWVNNNSTGTINGALIVGGNMTENGTMSIIYSSTAAASAQITALQQVGIYTQVAGTWRDFN